MSIVRMSEFRAQKSKINELKEFFVAIAPHMTKLPGCESVELVQRQDDPTKFTMVEVWDSVASHKASTKDIPADLIAKILPLIAGIPSGSYYDLVYKSEKGTGDE